MDKLKIIKKNMYQTKTDMPSAYIVDPKDRGRKKIYSNSKIYLSNNSEFQIELFNPTQDSVLAEIKINGKLASQSGLILHNGQRFFLDCFLDDKKKFIFKTYEVESTNEIANAIANNGFVEISFYKEKEYNNWKINEPIIINNWYNNWNYPYYQPKTIPIYPPNWWYNQPYYGNVYSSNTNSVSLSSSLIDNTINSTSTYNSVGANINTSFCLDNNRASKTISNDFVETGKVERGEQSNQKFENVNMNFENFCINKISYQILPDSKKPIEVAEIKKTNKYCHECGKTNDNNFKFCPSCGTKI